MFHIVHTFFHIFSHIFSLFANHKIVVNYYEEGHTKTAYPRITSTVFSYFIIYDRTRSARLVSCSFTTFWARHLVAKSIFIIFFVFFIFCFVFWRVPERPGRASDGSRAPPRISLASTLFTTPKTQPKNIKNIINSSFLRSNASERLVSRSLPQQAKTSQRSAA